MGKRPLQISSVFHRPRAANRAVRDCNLRGREIGANCRGTLGGSLFRGFSIGAAAAAADAAARARLTYRRVRQLAGKPNILFILSDQHNAKVLGCKGHPDVLTPNLDRMAAEGVRFENAITQNPICTPSRVSYLSGQYCHNHGYYGLSGPNPGGLPGVIGHFRRAGYATAAIGKIHCPEYWVEDQCDVFHETVNCSIGGRSKAYSEFLLERGKADIADVNPQHSDGFPSRLSYDELPDGWAAAESIRFMRRCREEGRPFFIHLSLEKPHQAYSPAREFWDLYDEEKIHLPPNADHDLAGKMPALRSTADYYRKGDWIQFEPRTFEAARRRKMRGYLGNVSMVDHAVGQVLEALRQSGLAEDTIVVYTADHGDYACEHGNMEKAPGICSDAITRVPCIWWGPGRLAAGRVADELVEAVDVCGTLAALAGLEAMETSDGREYSHLLTGGRGALREIAVTEFAWSKSVRRGCYRYVYYPREYYAAEGYPDGFGELYDLEADPWEMKNLYFDPSHAAVVESMRAMLLDWLVTTTRPATVLPWVRFEGNQSITRYDNSVNADGKVHPDRVRQAKAKYGNYI